MSANVRELLNSSSKDSNISVVWGVTFTIGAVLFLINIITQILAKKKTKFYTPGFVLIVSLLSNFLWCFIVVGLYCVINKVNPNGEILTQGFSISGAIMILIPFIFMCVLNIITFTHRTRDGRKGLELSAIGLIRDKMFENYGSKRNKYFNYIRKACTHGRRRDMNQYLQNNPPVLEIYAIKQVDYLVTRAVNFIQYGSWDKASAEKLPVGSLVFVKPEVEIHIPEEMHPKIEEMNKLMDASIGDRNAQKKVRMVIYGFHNGCIVGKGSKLYNFLNSYFGRAFHFISHFFGMSTFLDNVYHMKLKTIKPKVICRISVAGNLRNHYAQGCNDGEHDDAIDLHPYIQTPESENTNKRGFGTYGPHGYGVHIQNQQTQSLNIPSVPKPPQYSLQPYGYSTKSSSSQENPMQQACQP